MIYNRYVPCRTVETMVSLCIEIQDGKKFQISMIK